MHKPSNKIKWVASDAQKIVQKPHKRKVVHQKEIEEVTASTVLMPSKTRSGMTPQKPSSSYVTIDAPMKKRKRRKLRYLLLGGQRLQMLEVKRL